MASNPETGVVLLEIAYWWHVGIRSKAPEHVLKHPLWPDNNDEVCELTSGKIIGGRFATPGPGKARLWEAINAEFGLGL